MGDFQGQQVNLPGCIIFIAEGGAPGRPWRPLASIGQADAGQSAACLPCRWLPSVGVAQGPQKSAVS